MMDRTGAARRFTEHHNEAIERTAQKATAAGEQAIHQIENNLSRVGRGTLEFHQKVLAIAHANMNAAFDCARELLAVSSPSEFIQVSTKHARQQFQTMNQQSRELAELVQKTTIESMGPLAGGLGGALLGRPDLS